MLPIFCQCFIPAHPTSPLYIFSSLFIFCYVFCSSDHQSLVCYNHTSPILEWPISMFSNPFDHLTYMVFPFQPLKNASTYHQWRRIIVWLRRSGLPNSRFNFLKLPYQTYIWFAHLVSLTKSGPLTGPSARQTQLAAIIWILECKENPCIVWMLYCLTSLYCSGVLRHAERQHSCSDCKKQNKKLVMGYQALLCVVLTCIIYLSTNSSILIAFR